MKENNLTYADLQQIKEVGMEEYLHLVKKMSELPNNEFLILRAYAQGFLDYATISNNMAT